MSFDGAEVATLLDEYRAAYDPKKACGVRIGIVLMPAAKMPSYDPKLHYAGTHKSPDGKPSSPFGCSIHCSRINEQVPMTQGALLGLTDSGYTGARWEALYDQRGLRGRGARRKRARSIPESATTRVALENLFDSVANVGNGRANAHVSAAVAFAR